MGVHVSQKKVVTRRGMNDGGPFSLVTMCVQNKAVAVVWFVIGR